MLAFFMAGVTLTGHAQIKNWKGLPITAAAVDQFLKKQMDSLKIPALSIALINDGQLVYHRAWGVADLDTREPVNDSSLFEAASLSKPVFAFISIPSFSRAIA